MVDSGVLDQGTAREPPTGVLLPDVSRYSAIARPGVLISDGRSRDDGIRLSTRGRVTPTVRQV